MRDDLSAPRLGQAERDKFDAPFFWQSYRTVEQWMTRVLTKGPINVSTLTADEITSDAATVGTLAVTGSITSPQDTAQDAAIAANATAITANATAITGKVAKAGDTMSGDLAITKASPVLGVNKTAAGQDAQIVGRNNDLTRWAMRLGTSEAEGGSNAGSNFAIDSYNDAGAYLATPLLINRATGVVTVGGPLEPSINGTLDLGSTALRWRTVYTSDLSLSNGIGDWTIVEGADDLFITNNRSGKRYKFALIEAGDGD